VYSACYSLADRSGESSALVIYVGRVTQFDRLGGLTFRCATSGGSCSELPRKNRQSGGSSSYLRGKLLC